MPRKASTSEQIISKLREAEKINPGLTSPTDGTDGSESAGNAIVISIRKDNINPMRF